MTWTDADRQSDRNIGTRERHRYERLVKLRQEATEALSWCPECGGEGKVEGYTNAVGWEPCAVCTPLRSALDALNVRPEDAGGLEGIVATASQTRTPPPALTEETG